MIQAPLLRLLPAFGEVRPHGLPIFVYVTNPKARTNTGHTPTQPFQESSRSNAKPIQTDSEVLSSQKTQIQTQMTQNQKSESEADIR